MTPQRTFFLQVVFVVILAVVLHIWLRRKPRDSKMEDFEKPIILWNKRFWWQDSDFPELETCGEYQCYFTSDRKFETHPLLKASLIYGSNFNISDLIIPRAEDIQWGLYKDKSPLINPIFLHEEVLNLFNHSATFSRFSDVMIMDIPSMDNLTNTEFFFYPFEKKTEFMAEKDLASVLYIQSSYSNNNRDEYISKLMEYIKVDSYDSSLNNRNLTDDVRSEHEFHDFIAKYKFILAFEDAVCEDYISKELWVPLTVGSIPIYYGPPSFEDWIPNEKSVISVRDYPDPKKLAEYIQKISNDKNLYNQYLTHKSGKTVSSITNERLISYYTIQSYGSYFYLDIQNFQCHICKKVSKKKSKSEKFKVTRDHYSCHPPISALTQKPNATNPWFKEWAKSKCEAKLLSQYAKKNKKIDQDLFDQEVSRMLAKKEC